MDLQKCCFCWQQGLLKRVQRPSDHGNHSSNLKNALYAHPLCALYSTEVRTISYAELTFQILNPHIVNPNYESSKQPKHFQTCEICKISSHKVNCCVKPECVRKAHIFCIVKQLYHAKNSKNNSKGEEQEKKEWAFQNILSRQNETYQTFNLMQFLKSKKVPESCLPPIPIPGVPKANSYAVPLVDELLPRMVYCDMHSQMQTELPGCICGRKADEIDPVETWTMCDRCQYWYHNKCIGKPAVESEAGSSTNTGEWICDLCHQWSKHKRSILQKGTPRLTTQILPRNLQFHQLIFVMTRYQANPSFVSKQIVDNFALPRPIPPGKESSVVHEYLIQRLQEAITEIQKHGDSYLKKHSETQDLIEFLLQSSDNSPLPAISKSKSHISDPPSPGRKLKKRHSTSSSSRAASKAELAQLLRKLQDKFEQLTNQSSKTQTNKLGPNTLAFIKHQKSASESNGNSTVVQPQTARPRLLLNNSNNNNNINGLSVKTSHIANRRMDERPRKSSSIALQLSRGGYLEAVHAELKRFFKTAERIDSQHSNISPQENYIQVVRRVEVLKKTLPFQKPTSFVVPDIFGFICDPSTDLHQDYIKAVKLIRKMTNAAKCNLAQGEKLSLDLLSQIQKEYLTIPKALTHLVESVYSSLSKSGRFENQFTSTHFNLNNDSWLTPKVQARIQQLQCITKDKYLALRDRLVDAGRPELCQHLESDYFLLCINNLEADTVLKQHRHELRTATYMTLRAVLAKWNELKVKPTANQYNRVARYIYLFDVVSTIYNDIVKRNTFMTQEITPPFQQPVDPKNKEVQATFEFMEAWLRNNWVLQYDFGLLAPSIYQIVRLKEFKDPLEDPRLTSILSILARFFVNNFVEITQIDKATVRSQSLVCSTLRVCLKFVEEFGFQEPYRSLFEKVKLNLDEWQHCVARMQKFYIEKDPETNAPVEKWACLDNLETVEAMQRQVAQAAQVLVRQSFNTKEQSDKLRQLQLWIKISKKAHTQFLLKDIKMTATSVKELRDIIRESKFPVETLTRKKVLEFVDTAHSIERKLEDFSFKKRKPVEDITETVMLVANKKTVEDAHRLIQNLKTCRFDYDYKIEDIEVELKKFAQKCKDVEECLKNPTYSELLSFVNYFVNETPIQYQEFEKLRNALRLAAINEKIPIRSEKQLREYMGWGDKQISVLRDRYAEALNAYDKIKKLQRSSQMLLTAATGTLSYIARKDYTTEEELVRLRGQLLPDDHDYRQHIDLWLQQHRNLQVQMLQVRTTGRFQNMENIIQGFKRCIIDCKPIIEEYEKNKERYDAAIKRLALLVKKAVFAGGADEPLSLNDIKQIRQTIETLVKLNASTKHFADIRDQLRVYDSCNDYAYSSETYIDKLEEWRMLKHGFLTQSMRLNRWMMFKTYLQGVSISELPLRSLQICIDEFGVVQRLEGVNFDAEQASTFIQALLKARSQLSGVPSLHKKSNGSGVPGQNEYSEGADSQEEDQLQSEQEQESSSKEFPKKRLHPSSLKNNHKRIEQEVILDSQEDQQQSQLLDQSDEDDQDEFSDEDSQDEEDSEEDEDLDKVNKKARGNAGTEIINLDSD